MNSMNIHRITKIVTTTPGVEHYDSGKPYATGEITIFYTDYSGNPQVFAINLFGDTPEQLTIRGKA